jgi:signal transduction histidine kinase
MMRWLNSLQVRLYFILVSFALLSGVAIVAGNQSVRLAANTQYLVNLVGQQRANALLLARTADRLSETDDPTVRANIQELMQTLITNVEDVQVALRAGNPELNITPIQNPVALGALDELETRWQEYRTTLAEFTDADPTGDAAAQAALLERINTQSLTVFTFADRLATALGLLVEQEIASVQRLFVLIVVVLLTFLVSAFVITQRAIQSIQRLAGAADQLGKGDLQVRASTAATVEIASLAGIFNGMAEQIEKRVAELQIARERAEKSDQIKSAFLASMSHELRTPLNAVINFTRFVVDGDTGPVNTEQAELLTEVVNSARHLLNLINDVLDMSKIEAGSLNLFIEDNIDVHSILNSVLNTGRGLLNDKPIEFKTDIPATLPPLRGDRQRILQILLNIVSNACKFTQRGEIKLQVHTDGGQLQVSVMDTGPGIAHDDQELVFEAFKQTRTGMRQGGGTGLGMPIAKSLVEAHGGRIWLESEPNQGTTFYFTLPVKSAELIPMQV